MKINIKKIDQVDIKTISLDIKDNRDELISLLQQESKSKVETIIAKKVMAIHLPDSTQFVRE